MTKDIHDKPFDEGTQIKLYILREYLREWLPVFLSGKEIYWKDMYIYDFFAGEGSDSIGNYGSPLIILDELKPYCRTIKERGFNIKVVFNEYNKKKSVKLQGQCSRYIEECRNGKNSLTGCPNLGTQNQCVFSLTYGNHDFKEFFNDIYSSMAIRSKVPRFMFLDQYGIKFVTKEVLEKLKNLERTDFIFFISSSHARRFIENEEFQKYIKLSRQDFDEKRPYHCHRVIYNYFKSLLGEEGKLFLAPFSIKKNKNIYGLIFGSHHMLGMEKFLNIGWKINSLTGDANFDIDEENINPNQPTLFPELYKPNKIQHFENQLRNKIESKVFTTNLEIYRYTFDSGFLPKHANFIIQELKATGVLSKSLKTASNNIHRLFR